MYADPTNMELRFQLAKRYEEAGLWSDVVSTLEPMVKELDAQNRALLGVALCKVGEFQDAWGCFSEKDLNAQEEFYKGISALWIGKREEAVNALKRAVEKKMTFLNFI